jgi:hypothetical protein
LEKRQKVALGRWNAGESGDMARCRLGWAVKGRSDFEKPNLQNFVESASDAVEKTTDEDRRLRLRF